MAYGFFKRTRHAREARVADSGKVTGFGVISRAGPTLGRGCPDQSKATLGEGRNASTIMKLVVNSKREPFV